MRPFPFLHPLRFPLLVASLASAALYPSDARAFSSGPPDGMTGAPGESTCTSCHLTFPLNSGPGSLALLDAPEAYEPGQTYRLTVALADPFAMRWGFELTVLDASGARAGDVASIDGNTQTSTALSGREYIKHTSAGTAPGTSGSRQWQFDWTAPGAQTGTVTFWFAGNAANNNLFNTGDRIYNASASLDEDTVTAAPVVRGPARLLPSAPNPFNPRTTLRFALEFEQDVRLTIVDVRGRQVRGLLSERRRAGVHEVQWDGRDDSGRDIASGNYFARLVTSTQALGQTLTLIK